MFTEMSRVLDFVLHVIPKYENGLHKKDLSPFLLPRSIAIKLSLVRSILHGYCTRIACLR